MTICVTHALGLLLYILVPVQLIVLLLLTSCSAYSYWLNYLGQVWWLPYPSTTPVFVSKF
jgi:hypothetical protein